MTIDAIRGVVMYAMLVRFKRSGGVTLPELIVAVAVLSCLAAVAAPNVWAMVHTARLRGVAEVMASDLRWTMTESTKRQVSVSLTFWTSESELQWCYGRSMESSCDCSQAGSCVVDGLEQVVSSRAHTGVTIKPGISGNRFSTQPRRSTVTAGNVLFTAANGKQLKVVVSGYGRIRICTPAGQAAVGGYALC